MAIRVPSLTVNYAPPVFSNKKFTEYVNVNILERLIQSSNILRQDRWGDNDIYENELEQLIAYKKLIKYSKAEVIYNSLPHNYGRVFPKRSLSLGTLSREIRHTISKDYYVDIDIVNCHCSLLEQICIANNIKCPNLSYYNNNRDVILADTCKIYNIARDDTKVLFIILMYLGCFKTWSSKLDINKEQTDFISNFATELKAISVDIELANPEMKNDVIKVQKKEDRNKSKFWRSTIMSMYLQEYERRVLEEVYSYLCHHKYIIDNDCVLCFDGIMIVASRYNEKLLNELSIHIKQRLGFTLKFANKDMNNDIIDALEKNEEIIINAVEEKQMEKYRKYKEAFELKCAKINNPLCYKCLDSENGFVNEKKLKEIYRDHEFTFGKSHKKFINIWLDDPKKLKYDAVKFIPKIGFNNPKILNTFKGFNILNYSSTIDSSKYDDKTQEKRIEHCKTLLDFIKNLCNNDDETFQFLKYWMAWIIQKPHLKTGVCIVLISVLNHGVGKNTFFNLLSLLIGKEYTNCTADIHTIFNGDGIRFANGRRDKLLICLNEIDFSESSKLSNKMKDAITEDTFDIEMKGIDPIKCTNYNNYLIFSNKDVPILKEKADRRFYDIHIEKLPYTTETKDDYFKYIYDILNNENCEVLRTLYDYISYIKLDNINLQSYVLKKTNYDLINNRGIISREPIDEFFEHFVNTHNEVLNDVKNSKYTDTEYTNYDLYKKFMDYLIICGKRNYHISETQFGRFTQKYSACDKIPLNNNGIFITKFKSSGIIKLKISIPHMRAYYKC